jgi:peptide/nickel transport system substrate-binding protein
MSSDSTLEKLGLTAEDLSGPKVDRRTTMKLLATSGVGITSTLAGCAGGDGDGGDGGDGGDSGDSGDGGTTSEDGDVQTGGTLQAGAMQGEWDNVEPLRISATQTQQWMRNYAHGAVRANENLELVPELATDWTVEEDPFSITIDIREGIQFHSGREVLAEDFVFAGQRARNLETSNVVGETSFLRDPVDGTGVEALDDYRVRYNYKEPYAPGLLDLTSRGRVATPLDQQAVEEMGDDQHNLTPVGTGPFEITEHTLGDTLRFEAFDDFYMSDDDGNQLPYLDEIVVNFIPETGTGINALRADEIQFMDNVTPGQAGQLEGANGIRLEVNPFLRYEALVLNHAKDFASSVEARRAVAKVIDNEQFVEQALAGYGTPNQGPITPVHDWVYREEFAEPGTEPGGPQRDPTQNFDPEGAMEIIEENDLGGMEFAIEVTQGNERTARITKSIIEENSNGEITVNVELITYSQLVDYLAPPHDYEATFLGGGGYDPDGMMYNFWRLPPESDYPELADEGLSGPQEEGYDGIWNEERFTNRRVHELLGKQRTEPDREERKQMLWEIEDICIREVARCFTSVDDSIQGIRSSVNDFSIRAENQDFHQVWME